MAEKNKKDVLENVVIDDNQVVDCEEKCDALKQELDLLRVKFENLSDAYTKLRTAYIQLIIKDIDNNLGVYVDDEGRI